MRKYRILIGVLALSLAAKAQQNILVNNSGNVMYSTPISAVNQITFTSDYANFLVNSSALNIPKSAIESMTFQSGTVNANKIYIIYNGTNDATIINPYATQGVNITASGGNVTVTATSGISNLEYNLLGTSASGYLSMSSDQPATFVMNNLNLTNAAGPAIQVTGSQTYTFYLTPGTANTLSDGAASTKNGALQTAGPMIFTGTGTLGITGVKKHGISTSSSISIQSGPVTVNSAASDGFHSEGFSISGGSATVAGSLGDGIDAGDGNIAISNGTVSITSTAADVKAIKTGTGAITISGGTVNYTVSGAQSKGLSATGNITFTGGTTTANISGAAVLTASGSGYDPSYATAVKSGGTITLNGGTENITLTSTANGGKGFSAANINVTSGTVTVNSAGGNGTYTNTTGVADAYSSSALNASGNVTVTGGSLNLTTSGIDSKGISADGTVQISGGTHTLTNSGAEGSAVKADGLLTVSGGNTTINLSGAARLVASGSGYDGSYSSGLKSAAGISMTDGTVTITGSTAATGARGLSSDAAIEVSGGTLNVTMNGAGATFTNASGTTDSYSAACLKADTNVSITGGNVTLKSTGNAGKGINATGTITLGSTTGNPTTNITTTGGRILVSGTDYAHPKTIVANGAVTILNGTNTINSTDDGIHSDTSVTVSGGTNVINAISTLNGVGEGIEAPLINFTAGTTTVSASNDGINATYGTVSGGIESNDNSNLNISGGVLIVSGSDAIDSNGNITITGGTTIVTGPTNQPEEGIDFNGNFNMNGGLLISGGSNSAMTKAMSSTSTQVSMYLKSSAQLAATSMLHIENAAGTEMVTFKPKNAVYYFHFSRPTLAQGTQYKIYFGGTYTGGSFVGGGTWGLYQNGTYSTTGGTLKSTVTTSTTAKVNTFSF